jgi:hypothetical protein
MARVAQKTVCDLREVVSSILTRVPLAGQGGEHPLRA